MLEARFSGELGNLWVLYIDHEEKEFFYDELEMIREKFDLELTNEYLENAEDMWLQDPSEYIMYLESNGYTQNEI